MIHNMTYKKNKEIHKKQRLYILTKDLCIETMCIAIQTHQKFNRNIYRQTFNTHTLIFIYIYISSLDLDLLSQYILHIYS